MHVWQFVKHITYPPNASDFKNSLRVYYNVYCLVIDKQNVCNDAVPYDRDELYFRAVMNASNTVISNYRFLAVHENVQCLLCDGGITLWCRLASETSAN